MGICHGALVVARLLRGLAVGVAPTTCPVCISEVAPTDVRGRLVTLFQLAVAAGILVAYLVSLALTASETGGSCSASAPCPPSPLGLGMSFGPQSPRWLVMRGRVDDVRRPLLIEASGQTATFWLYAAIGVLTQFFVWRFVPETRGVALEEMEAIWRKRGERRSGGRRGGEAPAGVS